jgi:anti-anti-sigma factor
MNVTCGSDPVLARTTLATVVGNLDLTGSETFLAQVVPRINSQSPSLLLDLTQVEWVSSAGVGALVRVLTRTQAEKGSFALHGCATRVRTVLRICGLEDHLNVRDSSDEARARLRELGAG